MLTLLTLLAVRMVNSQFGATDPCITVTFVRRRYAIQLIEPPSVYAVLVRTQSPHVLNLLRVLRCTGGVRWGFCLSCATGRCCLTLGCGFRVLSCLVL